MLLTELYAQEQLDQVILDVFSDLNNYMILWFYVDTFRSNRLTVTDLTENLPKQIISIWLYLICKKSCINFK